MLDNEYAVNDFRVERAVYVTAAPWGLCLWGRRDEVEIQRCKTALRGRKLTTIPAALRCLFLSWPYSFVGKPWLTKFQL